MTRYIEADAVYKTLELCEIKKDTYGSLLNDWDHGYNCGIERAESEIECAPTVDVVPVRPGKWIRENNYGIWKCSECGCKVNRTNPLKGNIWNYYYCPNCGAKMDERREE